MIPHDELPALRAAAVRGLRELADFLTAHPDLPPPYASDFFSPSLPRTTEEDERAEVERIAEVLGIEAVAGDGECSARRFFGPVKYRAFALTRASMDRYRAWSSYSGSVTPWPGGAAGPPADPEPEPDRAAYVGGLRELAAFLEARPDLPEPESVMVRPDIATGDEARDRAEVDRIAGVLGVETAGYPASQYFASRRFGPVEYTAVAIGHESAARTAALRTYRDAVTP
ncbi:hypothetical protein [Actinomadura atramentaria]|uniref:hypothetical protein n=1 Tax=Actinomadura atramentaria TaxID=1990 RepID=UPI00036DF83F|nr:hypothetical protein [Actinomadura atramentaria]